MPRCGCVDNVCTCGIVGGRGVFLSGTGNENNPLLIDSESVAYFQRQAGSGAEVSVSGSGVPEDPYLVAADLSYVGSHPVTTEYIVPGVYTWTKPVGVELVKVTTIGGGAGGMAGEYAAAGLGGIGGAGGGWTSRIVRLDPTVTHALVEVGTGGNGGVAVPGSQPVGNSGGNTVVNFRNAANVSLDLVAVAGGGPSALWGGGMQPGQYLYSQQIPPHNTYSGAAGGGGGQFISSTTRVNLIPNPSFEVDTGGWALWYAGSTGVRSAAQAANGGYSYAMTPSTGSVDAFFGTPEGQYINVIPNQTYTAQIKTKATTGSARVPDCFVSFYNGGVWAGEQIMQMTNASNNSTFTQHARAFTATDAGQVRIGFGYHQAYGAGVTPTDVRYWDSAMLTLGNWTGMGGLPYFDGSTPNVNTPSEVSTYTWGGTAHQSASTSVVNLYVPSRPGGIHSPLYDGTTGVLRAGGDGGAGAAPGHIGINGYNFGGGGGGGGGGTSTVSGGNGGKGAGGVVVITAL
jgi:hypothetical protein